MTRARRIAAVLIASLAATGLAACGNHQEEEAGRILRAETEGIYLELGHLKYQVQVSRQLNPADPEDQGFLRGIPAAERELEPDEVWFGVFLRVQNANSEGPAHKATPTSGIEIEDTQEQVYEPIELDATNVFRYAPAGPLRPKQLIPRQDSPAAETPIQGSLVLFKVTNAALDNRPLELKIDAPELPSQTGIVNLDV